MFVPRFGEAWCPCAAVRSGVANGCPALRYGPAVNGLALTRARSVVD